MFNIDLKKAETALNAGRLDEAFTMLTSTPQRFHADGQRLVDRLVAALLERGSAHYQQLRYGAARNDAALAKQLGGPQVEVEHILQQVDARDKSFVQKEVENNENQFASRLAELVEAEQFEQAAMLIAATPKMASRGVNGNADVQRLTAQVGEAIRKQIDSDLRIGRLDRAVASLKTIEHAGIDDSQTAGLRSHIGTLSQIVSDGCRRYVYPTQKILDQADSGVSHFKN